MAIAQRISSEDAKMGPYFIVASVELGNTSAKCILTAADLEARLINVIDEGYRLTRSLRAPRSGEKVIGRTINGVELTQGSVKEFISRLLRSSLDSAKLGPDDLHFIVCSTSAAAGLVEPKEVDVLRKTVEEGCLEAGVRPSCTAPPLKLIDLPASLHPFSALGRGQFRGVVADFRMTSAKLSANDLECGLTMAGVKEGARLVKLDIRNPAVAIDLGTVLAGLVTGDGSPAEPIGSLCGLAGAVPDALARSSGRVDQLLGSALELPIEGGEVYETVAEDLAERAMGSVKIGRVAMGRRSVGKVPVDSRAAYEAGVVLVGCDVGKDGSDLQKLVELGREASSYGLPTLRATMDRVCARIAAQLIKAADDEGLLTERTIFGITGKAGTTGEKPKLMFGLLDEMGFDNIFNRVAFVEDGLALGAAVMARCLHMLCPACGLSCGARVS